MQTTALKIMGVSVNAEQPSNLEELLQLPGATTEKVFQAALKHTKYHCWFGLLRSKVVAELGKLGFKPKCSIKGKEVVESDIVDGEGKKTGTKWTFVETGKQVPDDKIDSIDEETEEVFFKRVCAEQNVEPSSYAGLFQKIVDENPINMNVKERSPRENKPSKTYLNLATEIFDAGVQEKVAAQVGSYLGEDITFTGDKDEDIKVLAFAIQTKEKREAVERRANLLKMV